MSDADVLHAAALGFLGACADALDLETDAGAPERVFVVAGPPAWDCPEQLTVHVGGPQIAETAAGGATLAPGHRIVTTGTLTLVSMTATILRCVPVASADDGEITFPSPADQQAAAAVLNADLWAIWNFLVDRKRTGQLFGPAEREFVLDPASALNPQGGVAGWQIPIRVRLDGYKPPQPVDT